MQRTGKTQILAHFFVEAGDDVFFRQRARIEEFGQQVVFAFGDQFDQFFMGLFGGFRVLGGDFGLPSTCHRHRAQRCAPSCGPDR